MKIIRALVGLVSLKICSAEVKDYMVWHQKDAMAEYSNHFKEGYRTLPFINQTEITYAKFDAILANVINRTLAQNNSGKISEDGEHLCCDNDVITIAEAEITEAEITPAEEVAVAKKPTVKPKKPTTYINGPVQCKYSVENVRFIILDTKLKQDLLVFVGVTFREIYTPNSGLSLTYCNPHGNQVLATALGTNYGVADGKGRNVTSIVNGGALRSDVKTAAWRTLVTTPKTIAGGTDNIRVIRRSKACLYL